MGAHAQDARKNKEVNSRRITRKNLIVLLDSRCKHERKHHLAGREIYSHGVIVREVDFDLICDFRAFHKLAQILQREPRTAHI